MSVNELPELMITLPAWVLEQVRPPTVHVRDTLDVMVQGLGVQLSFMLRVSPVATQADVTGAEAPGSHVDVRVSRSSHVRLPT